MNIELLRAIANAAAANTMVYLSQADAVPLMKHEPALIVVDSNQADPNDNSKRAVKITDAGIAFLASEHKHVAATKPQFAIQTGIELPKVQRRGGGGHGAPAKYPFDQMEVGGGFFVANTDVSKGNAVKTLNSAVGSANQRYAEDVIENGIVKTKVVERAKRDNKRHAIKDADGKNVMETVTLPVKNFTRKYVVRHAEAGKTYGSFTAPADGALVVRE